MGASIDPVCLSYLWRVNRMVRTNIHMRFHLSGAFFPLLSLEHVDVEQDKVSKGSTDKEVARKNRYETA